MEKLAVSLVNCARTRNLTNSGSDPYVTTFTPRFNAGQAVATWGDNAMQGHLMNGRQDENSGHADSASFCPAHHTTACTAGWSTTTCECRARKTEQARSKR